MDHLSPQQRHKNMAAIHSKNTKPEMIVRRGLWSRGFRYRLNHRGLPGHPDLVLRKYRTCIFVNGCFWHGHKLTESTVQGSGFMVQGSECCKIPKTNREFWVAKIVRNKERDKEVQRQLVWECELSPSKREDTLESIAFTLNHLWLHDRRVTPSLSPQGEREENSQIPMAAE